MIRAIIFDFDGLILDTEEPVYRSWLEVYEAHGEELPFERILTGYGLTEAGTVTGSKPDDDFEHIATTVGVPLNALVPERVTAVTMPPVLRPYSAL